MGIRKKIFLGFVIIGLILFTSGVISFFQLIGIEKKVADMNMSNIRCIETSGRMLNEAKEQTWKILDIMHENSQGENAKIPLNDALYTECLELILQNIIFADETKMLDTLRTQYQLFKYQTLQLDSLFCSDNSNERNEWFNTRYRPVYESFAKAANNLGIFNQNTISKNSDELEANFYRMVIPLIVAVAVGLLLIILFNYFINYYFISPILKISNGLKEYSVNKQPYNVKIDTQDEINELNREIKSLISHTKQKESAGVFNFNK
jgi:methyl-accepting chemotaxis protein